MNVTRANVILDAISIDTAIVEHQVGVARELVADLVHIETQMKASKARLRRAVAAASTSLTDIQHSSDPAEGRLQIDTHNPEPDDRLTAALRCPTAAPHSHRHVRRRRALR